MAAAAAAVPGAQERQTVSAGVRKAAPAGQGQASQATADGAKEGQAARVETPPVERSTRRKAKLPCGQNR